MSGNRRIERVAVGLRERYPKSFKAVYPRNIVVPAGFTDPILYGAILMGHLSVVHDHAMNELAHRTAYGVALSLVANRVPTYFIADEFAQAVANTDLPGDFKFAELKWPMEAQLFVLSDNFVESYYGHYAPFLVIGRLKAGMYPKDFIKPIPQGEISYPPIGLTQDRIILDYPFFSTEIPVTYNGSYPMADGIEIFKSAPWNDATVFENAYHSRDLGPKVGGLTREQEDVFAQKAQQLAVKLLLTIAEMPALIEHGHTARHAIVVQSGRVKLPELVSANVIGRTYRIPRRYAPGATTGTRAKPRFKYRRGHYAWVAKRFKNVEFISVEEMPRKLEGFIDFDAAGTEKADKFRACHIRTWIEGFFFDEEVNPTIDNDKT